MHKHVLGIAIALFVIVGAAQAKSDWNKVATLNAGGEAKEVAVNREISNIRITAEKGAVVINTVVVRAGSLKTPHTIGAQLEEKARREIDLGSKQSVTGLRISDGGSGSYSVYVK